MKPAVSVKTIGCRLNQAETAILLGHFVDAGYRCVPFGRPTDVAVIHGCAITQRAQRESLQSVRQARRVNPEAMIVLAGCPAEILTRQDNPAVEADLVVGQSSKMQIPVLLHRIDPGRFPPAQEDAPHTPHIDTRRAYIKVQDGCDFHCSYCIVPKVRGKPSSRPLDAVVVEATRLVKTGFRELILTGANLGCYDDGHSRLIPLLRAVDQIAGIGRYRLGSVEPLTAEKDIVDFMCESSKICRHLHLPLQSGDDAVLARLGRRYSRSDYLRTAEYATSKIPFLGLGTDVIVGFPGETDAAFRQTVDMIKQLPFCNVHVFPYSRRPGTRAASMPGQVPDAVKKERAAELRILAAAKRSLFAATFCGRQVCILVEKILSSGHAWGWTSEYLEGLVPARSTQVGELLTFTIVSADETRLLGTTDCNTSKAAGFPSP